VATKSASIAEIRKCAVTIHRREGLSYDHQQAADMQASMEFKLPAQVRKKGKWFISSCNLLDVHSQGHTREQAERNLKDALATFLLSCYERGTLEIVLREVDLEPSHSERKLL
jgi:predicted RNase H-like HicB family nuclease